MLTWSQPSMVTTAEVDDALHRALHGLGRQRMGLAAQLLLEVGGASGADTEFQLVDHDRGEVDGVASSASVIRRGCSSITQSAPRLRPSAMVSGTPA